MSELENVKIRNGTPFDYEKVVSVMPEWWDGRDLSSSVLKVFFIHFNDTTYIAEIDDELVGFLIGFMSQSDDKVGYIHFSLEFIHDLEDPASGDSFLKIFMPHVKQMEDLLLNPAPLQ